MESYKTVSPVLFLIFNRPVVTAQVFARIRQVKPSKLYVAADGPRNIRDNENIICDQTRAIINNIDWDCELKTLYRTENQGCKQAVSSAITWFFDNEEEGIILEDDCLPAISFFHFCDSMLDHYRTDTRIRHISGCNLQHGGQWGQASYYFSNLTHVWGWASWKRVWVEYDVNLSRYNKDDVEQQLAKVFNEPFIVKGWVSIFKNLKDQMIDTWDYQLTFTNFFNNGLSIIPNVNLISNLGFGAHSTHTTDEPNPNSNIPLAEITTIQHPKYILPEKLADAYTLNADFNIAKMKKRHNSVVSKIKRLFNA